MPSAQNRFRETRFASERLNPIGVEILTVSELWSRVSDARLRETERVGFYLLLVGLSGDDGSHLVDFQTLTLRKGHVIFVRPGQLQQWQPRKGLRADVLLIDPVAVQPRTSTFQATTMALLRLDDWPSHFELDAEELSGWQVLASMLRHELRRPILDELSAAVARELLSCLMLKLGRAASRRALEPSTKALMLRTFRLELDASVAARPTVEELARKLRVSTSTLTRACKELLGRTAKEEVDRRIVLEAQRLLVHGSASSAAIGEQLGFSEPTNFVKFFRRLTGTAPEAFRRAHRLVGDS